MDIGIFDIVGPVMVGPSSSGTAGMVRIGSVGRAISDGVPKNVEIQFHPRNLTHYAGCRSHLALAGGLMGYATDEPGFPDAFEAAKRAGMKFQISCFPAAESKDALRVRLVIESEKNVTSRVCAVSVGGGNIVVESIDEVPVKLNNYSGHYFIWSDTDVSCALSSILGDAGGQKPGSGRSEYTWFSYIEAEECDREVLAKLRAVPGVVRAEWIAPFFEGGNSNKPALFKDYSEILEICGKEHITVSELMLRYEVNRSGLSEEKIIARMRKQWEYMKRSAAAGISGEARPLYGLDDGQNGRRILEAVRNGRTLSGSIVGNAVAYGIGIMEYAMSMGCIVASPTCGSSGIVPGCLVSLQEAYGYTDDQIVDALFACTSIGVIMAFDGVRFSGVAAGCQGEITVSSAMAAQAMACLGGGGPVEIGDAASLAIKGMLGLVCDPMECVEVPCIKRNGGAIGNAFAAADMVLSGVRSFITPDDASYALYDVQEHLPAYLRGGGGGVACTHAAHCALEKIHRMDEEYLAKNL